MITTTRYDEEARELIVITECRQRLEYLKSGMRDIVRVHHCAAAGRALAEYSARGMWFSRTEKAAEEYWDDGVLAHKNAVALITVFIMYFIAGMQPIEGVSTEGASWAMEGAHE